MVVVRELIYLVSGHPVGCGFEQGVIRVLYLRAVAEDVMKLSFAWNECIKYFTHIFKVEVFLLLRTVAQGAPKPMACWSCWISRATGYFMVQRALFYRNIHTLYNTEYLQTFYVVCGHCQFY